MKKIFSKLLVIVMVVVALFSFSACNDAEIVQHKSWCYVESLGE